MPDPDDIVYLRARIASEEFDLAGRKCRVIEPITKSGKVVDSPWVFNVPSEWLIPIDEMRRVLKG